MARRMRRKTLISNRARWGALRAVLAILLVPGLLATQLTRVCPASYRGHFSCEFSMSMSSNVSTIKMKMSRQAWSKLVGGNVRLWTSHMMMMSAGLTIVSVVPWYAQLGCMGRLSAIYYHTALTSEGWETFTNHKFCVGLHATFGLNDRRIPIQYPIPSPGADQPKLKVLAKPSRYCQRCRQGCNK